MNWFSRFFKKKQGLPLHESMNGSEFAQKYIFKEMRGTDLERMAHMLITRYGKNLVLAPSGFKFELVALAV